MATTDKQQLQMPDLPSVVQGDGRHVMSLLRKYLKEMAVQINLANDFEGEPEQDTGLAAPSGFVLRFGVDGGEFSWKEVPYISKLAYYELRTNRSVGNKAGLLSQTINLSSAILPVSYQATVYLYAVLKDGTYSNASIMTYTKARPEAPQKINLTKNEQGTLIQFTEIPLDCMGANIYVNDEKISVTDNIYLYTKKNVSINTIGVAYFDQFGEGEKAIISCYVPNVTDFIVERNGAVLDFYWEPVNVHGVQYVVQVSETPIWGTGVELFTTALNKKKLEYPNTGDKYFLIKAFDEQGNYSSEATWYKLSTAEDPSRNHIITFDEHAIAYPNVKFGVWYDAVEEALRFTQGVYTGEYIFCGVLPKEYRARNWAEFKIESTSGEEWWRVKDALYAVDSEWATTLTVGGTKISENLYRVKEALYPLDDEWAVSITVGGGGAVDGECISVKSYIATYEGAGEGDVFLASLDGTNVADTGEIPTVAQYADTFAAGRWHQGIKLQELTRLRYQTGNAVTRFTSKFVLKLESELEEGFIVRWSGTDGWLELRYNDGFYLVGSDGISVYVPYTWERLDAITVCISQGASLRGLYIKSFYTIQGATAEATPIGVLSQLQFNKGE